MLPQMIQSHLAAAQDAFKRKNFLEAAKIYQILIQIHLQNSGSLDVRETIAKLYLQIAYVWECAENNENALFNYQQALTQAAGNSTLLSKVHYGFAQIYDKEKNIPTALFHYHQVLEHLKKSDFQLKIFDEAHSRIADIYYKEKKYWLALMHYQMVNQALIKASEEGQDNLLRHRIHYRIASSYEHLGVEEEANEYYETAARLTEEKNDLLTLAKLQIKRFQLNGFVDPNALRKIFHQFEESKKTSPLPPDAVFIEAYCHYIQAASDPRETKNFDAMFAILSQYQPKNDKEKFQLLCLKIEAYLALENTAELMTIEKEVSHLISNVPLTHHIYHVKLALYLFLSQHAETKETKTLLLHSSVQIIAHLPKTIVGDKFCELIISIAEEFSHLPNIKKTILYLLFAEVLAEANNIESAQEYYQLALEQIQDPNEKNLEHWVDAQLALAKFSEESKQLEYYQQLLAYTLSITSNVSEAQQKRLAPVLIKIYLHQATFLPDDKLYYLQEAWELIAPWLEEPPFIEALIETIIPIYLTSIPGTTEKYVIEEYETQLTILSEKINLKEKYPLEYAEALYTITSFYHQQKMEAHKTEADYDAAIEIVEHALQIPSVLTRKELPNYYILLAKLHKSLGDFLWNTPLAGLHYQRALRLYDEQIRCLNPLHFEYHYKTYDELIQKLTPIHPPKTGSKRPHEEENGADKKRRRTRTRPSAVYHAISTKETIDNPILKKHLDGFGSIGSAHNNNGCFFESFAQGINQITGKNLNERTLRIYCKVYYDQFGEEVEKLFQQREEEMDVMYQRIQRCQADIKDNSAAIMGRYFIEAIILIRHLKKLDMLPENYRLHVIEAPDPTNGIPVNLGHYLVDESGYSRIPEVEAMNFYKDTRVSHIALSQNQLHYVPIEINQTAFEAHFRHAIT